MAIFSSDGEFIVTHLRPIGRAGYEEAAFTLYTQVCHNLAPNRWTEKQLPRLGYRSQSRQQDRYETRAAALATLR